MSTYYKNTELAARYNISEATVRNWIKSTKEGKLHLELTQDGSRAYVAKSISNIPIIEELIKHNRKYRNTLAAKTITPNPELFELFSEAQVYDIVRNLELHREIPLQYQYFGEGVERWDKAVFRQVEVNTPSMLRGTIELLASNYSYIDKRLDKFKKVNVIDIGVGNAIPVRGLLAHLISQNKLNRYIGLDFSNEMLDLARRRLLEWFGPSLRFEGYEIDIAHERFSNIIAEDYLQPKADTVNLVLLLGATPNNLRVPADAFRAVCESMNPGDLFIYTDNIKPLVASPEWFEYSYDNRPQKPELLTSHRLVLDKLNIKDAYYVSEIGLDEVQRLRYSRVKLKYALTLRFEIGEGYRVVQLEKGDAIILWRCWRKTPHTLLEMLESSGFYILHTSQSEDHNYILTIAEVQRS